MSRVWSLLVLWAGIAYCYVDVPDFDDWQGGYDFIYHDAFDLIVMKQNDRCYFVHFPDDKENELDSHMTLYYHHTSPLKVTENSLLHHAWNNKSGDVIESSLQAVRNKYHDLLADFECADKRIYEMSLDPNTRTTTTAMSKPDHHTLWPGTRPDSSGVHHLCDHLKDGMHPYPGNCHTFLVCSGGMSFQQVCADGTAFDDVISACVFEGQVARCGSRG